MQDSGELLQAASEEFVIEISKYYPSLQRLFLENMAIQTHLPFSGGAIIKMLLWKLINSEQVLKLMYVACT